MTNSQSVAANNGETYPSLTTESGTLTFSISGVSSGTTTEGVTTDVTTTATAISFGSLTVNAETEAAQRLTVSTNATEGYKIYVYQRQGLVGSGSLEIPSVSASNDAPAAWAIPSSATGAYGYHAGDDALSDGSTRFATNDTYAKLESVFREIVFSSVPVTSEATDIVYKVQITNLQEADSYSSTVVYLIVPVS